MVEKVDVEIKDVENEGCASEEDKRWIWTHDLPTICLNNQTTSKKKHNKN